MTILHSLFAAIPASFLALVTVINPLGTGFLLNSMTEGIDPQTRKALARKIVFNCLGLFLVVLLLGNHILFFFGLSLPIIRVGGGLLLAAMGWRMLNASDDPKEAQDLPTAPSTHDYFSKSFYPYTFPVTAGPGCIAVLFTLSAHHGGNMDLESTLANLSGTFIGLTGVAILIYFCYVYSALIKKNLGESGANAVNRIMAFITLCIGLQILWVGIQSLSTKL